MNPLRGSSSPLTPWWGQGRAPYSYVAGNPLNAVDPSGQYSYDYSEEIGSISQTGGAAAAMHYLQNHLNTMFPFPTGNCTKVQRNATCDLPPFLWLSDPVTISGVGCKSFTFTAQGGSTLGKGSTITFSTYEENGNVYLEEKARAPDAAWFTQSTAPIIAITTWGNLAGNLHGHFVPPPLWKVFLPKFY